MSLPQLLDGSGRHVALDRLLATGGEGSVYLLQSDPNFVAKVYHKPTDKQAIKLSAMIGMAHTQPRLLKVATWPSSLLFDRTSRLAVGFLMPRLVGYKEIWQLYNPVPRLTHFPKASWLFQVHAACNLAAAFDEVHKTGCVIGDVQMKNAQVSERALVRLVDCDSFQVFSKGSHFYCEVGLPDYTPPELQNKPFDELIRTTNHDCFGLAVLIYQLLFVGRHPFAGYIGPDDPSFQRLIAEYRFSQSPNAAKLLMQNPRFTPSIDTIPNDVATLFRRAFERGSESGGRPRPVEWLNALQNLAGNTVKCKEDTGHTYWRQAKECVWCRLAANGGPEYYFGVASEANTFEVNEDKLQEIIRRLNNVQSIDYRYDRNDFIPLDHPRPEPIPRQLREHRTVERILRVVFFGSLFAMPLGFVHAAFFLIAILAFIVFGLWLWITVIHSPWQQEYYRRTLALRAAENDLVDLERSWNMCISSKSGTQKDIRRQLDEGVSKVRYLALHFNTDHVLLKQRTQSLAELRHLRLHMIADACITGIGGARKQTLQQHNIYTAADLNWDAILSISGFGGGLASNLMAWKEEIIRKFRLTPTTAISATDFKALVVKYRTQQKQLLLDLNRLIVVYESIPAACFSELKALKTAITISCRTWCQANSAVGAMRR
jgi:DNA-binding helix-hairpin-helix protein with protein kinase domain